MTKFLWRYTNIPALIYLLREKKITLLDPETWDDKNDSHFLSLYRDKKSLKSVLALCFTQVSETYHHSRVFADGSSGICIRFKRAELMKAITKLPGVKVKAVDYLTLEDIKKKKLKTNDLPFLKRFPYMDEVEFRVIYESSDAYNNRGYAYKVKGDIDRAIEDYNRAISLGSKNPQHFVNRAAALTIKGDYDLAEADFEAAPRFDNKSAVALYRRGFVKNKRGDDAAGRQDMLDGTKLNANAEKAFVIATKPN